ncbi:unnamed protein product [Prunus armeniaca]
MLLKKMSKLHRIGDGFAKNVNYEVSTKAHFHVVGIDFPCLVSPDMRNMISWHMGKEEGKLLHHPWVSFSTLMGNQGQH